jgi:hypothetical protein
MLQPLRIRVGLLVAITFGFVGVYWSLVSAHHQPLDYHEFADQRPLFGVPHALNVLSNLPYVLFGLLGMWFLASRASDRPGVFLERCERWPYWVYFVGLVLTGVGSAYYHANPNNETLVWDRAALAVMFMGLFTAILAERVHVACIPCLLGPLVLFGAGSVFYWIYTERLGAGDLRFYFTVQFFPLLMVPILLALYPPRYTHAGDLLAALLCYGLAKGCELLDHQVYTGGAIVSGHTLKHLISGVGSGFILLMLWRRQPIGSVIAPEDLPESVPVRA